MKALKCKEFLDPFFLAFQSEAMTPKILQNDRGATADNLSSDVLKEIKLLLLSFFLQPFVFQVADAKVLRQKQQESKMELEQLFQALLQQ